VTVSGGTFGGNGSISGAVTISSGATLAPGQNASGLMTIGNGLTLSSGGHLAMTLNGTGIATQYAPVSASGTISLGGDLQLTLGYTPAIRDTFYVILDQGGAPVSNAFSNAVDQGNGTGLITVGADQFLVSYSASQADGRFMEASGHDVALQVIAVPEPGALVSLLGGAGMLMVFRRRRAAYKFPQTLIYAAHFGHGAQA
jgi:hypothetical protein